MSKILIILIVFIYGCSDYTTKKSDYIPKKKDYYFYIPKNQRKYIEQAKRESIILHTDDDNYYKPQTYDGAAELEKWHEMREKMRQEERIRDLERRVYGW